MRGSRLVSTLVRWFLNGLQGVMWACAILLAVLAMYTLLPPGASDRAHARQRALDEISSESRVFCEWFGMPVGTEQHPLCVVELQRIREREDRRAGSGAPDLL